MNTMYVQKRNGNKEELSVDKIARRIQYLAEEPIKLDKIVVYEVVLKVCENIINGISTTELDNIASNICADNATDEYQYGILSTRISISNLHKNTYDKFSEMIQNLAESDTMIASWVVDMVKTHSTTYDNMIVHERDYLFDYFGFKTLEKMYLMRSRTDVNMVVERPQYMWMRTAIEIWKDDFAKVKETYDLLSQHWFTHATPTLFNSCLKKNQLSSCMLLTNEEDSVEGIYESLKKCSILGANAAGIGLDVTNIRAAGTLIKSTNRPSRGVPAFLQVYNENVKVIDQGGKRKMSIAIYMQPWHKDFPEFLHMRANDNLSPIRARELFYAIWTNELLFKRAAENKDWTMFCPVDAPKLMNTHGKEFEENYIMYESNNEIPRRTIAAQALLSDISRMMMETGVPYCLNKDACNAKSNMKNVSHINSSNLCAEILIPSGNIDGQHEIGVCTLASINLSKFVKPAKIDVNGIHEYGTFDFKKLGDITRVVTRNLNKVIDTQYYPLPEGKLSSLRHRPIGIGVQGLADVFMMMGYEYGSDESKNLNWEIAEEIYYNSILESMELAKEEGSYETFAGSPASFGKLQPHLWVDYGSKPLNYRKDWESVGKLVAQNGLRNALLVAWMPTASTSQLMGNFPSFEPAASNIFTRTTLAGDFTVINKHLVDVLSSMGIWSSTLKDEIIAREGSIQDISSIPDFLKPIYKTVWEISPKRLLDMNAQRGQFICHTQSFNLYITNPSVSKLTSILMYGFKLGLKTIAYYTRSLSASNAVKISINREMRNNIQSKTRDNETRNNDKFTDSSDDNGCNVCMA